MACEPYHSKVQFFDNTSIKVMKLFTYLLCTSIADVFEKSYCYVYCL